MDHLENNLTLRLIYDCVNFARDISMIGMNVKQVFNEW